MGVARYRWMLVAGAVVVTGIWASAQAESPVEVLSLGPEEVADEDADGLLDYLKVPVRLRVAAAGTYVLSFHLQAGDRSHAQSASVRELDVGEQLVRGEFKAPTLHQARYRGPYEVSVSVTTAEEAPVQRRVLAKRTLVTAAYDWQQFADRVTYCFDDDGTMITDWLICATRGLE